MLATLLLALAAAGTPAPAVASPWNAPIDQPAFCRDLKALIAAAVEAPTPFASVTRPGDEQKGQWSPTAGMQSFGWCSLARYGDTTAPSLQCARYGSPLAERRAEAAQAVRECTGVEPLPEAEDPPTWSRETVFETAAWTLTLSENGCDRCRGMPSLQLWLRRR